MKQNILSFFKIRERKSTVKTECLAGLSTFLSMAYIVSVHPQILSQTGMSFSACVTATICVCFFSSMAMGLYANNPIVLGPGLSLSGFFTFTLVGSQGVPYETALGATFWVGVIFFGLSLFRIREKLALSVPSSLKSALICGIGLFVAFMGLKEGRMIVHSETTFLRAEDLTAENITFLLGLALTFVLLSRKVRGAFLLSIVLITFLCFPLGRFWGGEILLQHKGFFSAPDFSAFARMDLWGALKYSSWPVLLSIAFVDLFESLGSVMGITRVHPLMSENGRHSQNLKKTLLVDASATAGAGLFGSSSVICFLESLVGIYAGGKTGLTAVVTACLFLPFLFLSPLLSMIPSIATAPILVVLGSYMMKSAGDIEWHKPEEALPAFMMILLIPLCFSIIQGIIYGFLFYTSLQIVTKRGHQLSPYMYGLSVFCLIFLFFKPN